MKFSVGTVLLAGTLITAHPAQQQIVEIPDREDCPSCTIEIHSSVQLRHDGSIQNPHDVEVDAQGRFWAVFPSSRVMVFGRDGRFLQTVGSTGDGPGEFRGAYRVASAGTSMLVIDSDGGVSVFGLDFDYLGRTRVPARVYGVSVIEWPESVLFNGRVNTSGSVGFPLHLVDASEYVAVVSKSFGLDPHGELRPGQTSMMRKEIWRADDGIWVADRLQYRVAQWNRDGELLSAVKRSPDWFSGITAALPGLSNRPPEPSISGVSGDNAGRLWVFTRVPALDWRQKWIETEEKYGKIPEGAMEVDPNMVPSSWDLWETMVEVIDPIARRVIVRQQIDEYVIDVVADGRIVTYAESGADFAPILKILSLRIETESGLPAHDLTPAFIPLRISVARFWQ